MSIIDAIKEKKYFTSASGADFLAVQDAENILGLQFAEEYKEYVLAFGVASYRGHELSGLSKSERLNVVSLTLQQRKLNPDVPVEWYVLEKTDIDDIIIWQDNTGAIYETAPGREHLKIYNTLLDYIRSE